MKIEWDKFSNGSIIFLTPFSFSFMISFALGFPNGFQIICHIIMINGWQCHCGLLMRWRICECKRLENNDKKGIWQNIVIIFLLKILFLLVTITQQKHTYLDKEESNFDIFHRIWYCNWMLWNMKLYISWNLNWEPNYSVNMFTILFKQTHFSSILLDFYRFLLHLARWLYIFRKKRRNISKNEKVEMFLTPTINTKRKKCFFAKQKSTQLNKKFEQEITLLILQPPSSYLLKDYRFI